MTEQTRRDVLCGLASTVALPAASNVDLEGGGQQARLPDIPEGDPFWVVVYAASDHEPHEVIDELLPAMATLSPYGMGADEVFHYVREASRGEYDEDELERRAAYVWGLHR